MTREYILFRLVKWCSVLFCVFLNLKDRECVNAGPTHLKHPARDSCFQTCRRFLRVWVLLRFMPKPWKTRLLLRPPFTRLGVLACSAFVNLPGLRKSPSPNAPGIWPPARRVVSPKFRPRSAQAGPATGWGGPSWLAVKTSHQTLEG